MKILGIETTGKYAGVCVGMRDGEFFCKTNEMEMEHLSQVLPMAEELLRENEIRMEDIDALAVSVGPGSFTGMRIGIAFARAIAQARNLKCIAVNTLAAFCLSENAVSQEAEFCIPLLDARRGQIYAALYKLKPGVEMLPSEELGTDIYMIEDFLELLKRYILKENPQNGRVFFVSGNASVKYAKEVEKLKENLKNEHGIEIALAFETSEKVEQSAYNVCKLGKLLYENNRFTAYNKLEPIYLRKAEAERKLEKIKQEELEKASDIISI